MSALPPIADITAAQTNVRFVPKADILRCGKKGRSFDHFVGELQEMLGNVEPKRFCGLEIDDKLKLDWRLCGEFGRLLALQNTIDI